MFINITMNASAQSGYCNISEPFCTNDVMVFPAGVDTGDAEEGPSYGCLLTQHNPAWYHMLIETPGDIILEISSTPLKDIDFICWGPFSDPHSPCNGQLTSSKEVDCSYAGGTAPEICNIPNTQVGEYYILLLTNYSNDPCSITFSKTGGTGETDCGIVPGAASNNSPICEGEDLELYAEPISNATYSWTGPAGFTSNIQNPIIPNAQLSNAGIYNLTVTLGGNSSNPYPTEAIINALPTVSFSFSAACSSEPTQFTDLSTCSTSNTPVVNWLWDFGDGSTSTNQNPVHTYPNTADIIYQVKLIATTTGGCIDSITQPVEVHSKPVADFSFDYSNNTSCINSSVEFINSSSTSNGVITNYSWDFGDGNTSVEENPVHSYATDGSFTVSLTVTNTAGCDSLIEKQVLINPNPTIDFSFTEVCDGNTTSFIDSDYIDVGNTLTWLYEFGDGNTSNQSDPSHTYSNAGNYNVVFSITDINGCNNNISHSVSVFENPIALFSFDTVCQNSLTAFTDLSTPPSMINNWLWDFGDGTTDNIANPQHLFDVISDEIFSVELFVTTNESCSGSISQDVLVLGKPIADFSFSTSTNGSCIDSEIEFDNLSTTNSGAIETSYWDFGDGSTSTDENPTHNYISEGVYDISLTVTNTGGCDSTIIKQISIYGPPEIDFSFNEVCNGLSTQFYDTNFINVGATSTWTYDFDDGNTSNESNPLHLFENAGNYYVSFSIVDTNGCFNSISHSVEVFDSPIAQFSFDTVCQFSPTHFYNESNPASEIDFWEWDFGDEQLSYLENPEHIYDTSGYYQVSLITGIDENCYDTITQNVWVWEPPIAHFLHSDTSCTTGLVLFNDSSISNESNIANYKWNFPDGHVSYEANTYFVFLYTETYYNVSLEIADARGCSDTAQEQIYINADLQMSFIADTVCFGDKTSLSAYIVKPQDDSIAQYTWLFNDGGAQITTPNNTIEHEFLSSGTFEVKLQATNIYGCSDVIRKNVKVRPNPVANFSFQESYCQDSTIFKDLSTSAEGEINYWKWDYGDGQSLEINSPNNPDHYHFFPPTHSTYETSLLTINEFGCKDSSFKEVVHYPCVLVNFYNDTSWICQNTPAVFIDSIIVDSDFSISEKIWFFGDGNSMAVSPEIDTVYYQYQNHGEYEVKLVVTYEGGDLQFTNSTQNSIIILPSPNPLFSTNTVCLNEATEFTDLSSIDEDEIETVFWRYGDGQDTSYVYQANSTIHNHTYNQDGDFPASLYIIAKNNCSDSLINQVIVHPIPEMGFKADSTIFCKNATVFFTDTSRINSGFIANRLWTFGDGDFISLSKDTTSHHYDHGVYSVSLENTSNQHCKSKIILDDYIIINPIIEADFEIDPEQVSIQNKSDLEITNYVPEDTYLEWVLSDTILWENVYSPNIIDSIFDTGFYELKMYTINEFGCIDSSSQYFEVTPVYSFFVPTGFSPNGNGTNDTFGPIGKYFDMKSYSFMIFDRWGKMVFKTNDFFEQWDGKNDDGNILPIDTYGWVIQLVDMDGNNKVLRGAVTLLL